MVAGVPISNQQGHFSFLNHIIMAFIKGNTLKNDHFSEQLEAMNENTEQCQS